MLDKLKAIYFKASYYFNPEYQRLKDIVIDYIYFYCYEQIVPHYQTADGGEYIGFEKPENFEVKGVVNKVRDKDRVRILIEGSRIHTELADRFNNMNIKRPSNFYEILEKEIIKLKAGGYILEDLNVSGAYSLTQKGKNHYVSGNSLEDKFINKRNSFVSIFISLIALFISILL